MKHPPSTPKLALQGATVLTPTGWLESATVLIEDGKFVAVDQAAKPSGYVAVDVTGLHLLPGIIDIHGDAFERMICPRPGVNLPLDMALVENDLALLGAGITTFFYSITDSFEPGLRSRDMARQLINRISEPDNELRVDSRIHIRHEQANTADYDELCNWLETHKVTLISLNNHLPLATDDEALQRYTKGLRQRLKLSEADILALIQSAYPRQEEGLAQFEDLVQRCHHLGIPVASHDDETAADVAKSRERGVAIAEFPASIPLAAASRAYGAAVLMGAPNLVRGGSHVGYMSVAEAAQSQVLDCLCSDYHYPSLFHAPFLLAEKELMPFEQAWKCVSEYPAEAAKIGDQKGKIAPGYDADFLLLTPDGSLPSAIRAVYINGLPVKQSL
ncbi:MULTISPECIES: alpha-D-ribose 1-methylphosphonate 5-triphosphate diphosphatase [Cyanophyceae]|uniref:alpha-D-ribose 1-methylphosphonate 5-triphosphate diphosphatase n=1 Tax=Cyanophyceae TaxID=3028117 RepID=UPI0016824981|nr:MULTISPECIES: alpha-D-ribose 1-methylphosphonate 5-triphosphate diphosphatase [Cyanophyceae]MBD1915451.1 alpha-D-ribose 1-methylphosphonate 5-triphosphate diphosphatase [Phormidium sp. FACHB-77]MBD2028522.1 alpha-D-ribose 1-methylphosphonate 5-triphosphate diphosphatase [Phormidium sp. FACHB-322]MBD2051062.1 alpha-D-ribose 1-methylphosphonate 5-triphosphate diphosphatase [Leptolyngbya sp. FACHB-60]